MRNNNISRTTNAFLVVVCLVITIRNPTKGQSTADSSVADSFRILKEALPLIRSPELTFQPNKYGEIATFAMQRIKAWITKHQL